MRDQRRPRIFPGTDVRYGSIFFVRCVKTDAGNKSKLGQTTYFEVAFALTVVDAISRSSR